MAAWLSWRAAAQAALYGPDGFYRRPEGPVAHFRTSVHASRLFAGAVARLLCRVDEALGRAAPLAFVDMAAGRGELVTGVLAALPAEVAARTRAYAVEVAARPDGLDERVTWLTEPPTGVTGLLFANEWLDNVPVDVAQTDPDGVPRQVLVRRDGTERLGEPVAGEDARWLERWWPLSAREGGEEARGGEAHGGETGENGDLPAGEGEALRSGRGEALQAGQGEGLHAGQGEGLRAEIGHPRDAAWASAVATLDRGLAVAVDYAHTAAARPPFGTLTGYRAGHETPPVPDGTCDLTAHVALDACALPGARTVDQRTALHTLGVSGVRPPLSLATTDPAAYVRALADAGEAGELTARGGLGDFVWLLQPVGIPDVLGTA